MVRIIALVAALGCACATSRKKAWEDEPAAAPAPAAEPAAEGTTAEDPFAGALAAADAAWGQRADRAQTEAAIARLEEALNLKPRDGETLARLSRAYSFYADAFLRTEAPAKMREFLLKGVDAGERALVLMSPAFADRVKGGTPVREAVPVVEKDAIAPLYWYGVNLGRWARAEGFTTLLRERDNYKACMERVYALDPAWFYGAGPRALGALYAVAPAFAGGDLDKAKKYYDESLSHAPDYLATKVLMAENWATKKQDQATFEKLLNEVMEAPADLLPEVAAEQGVEKQKAQDFMAKKEDLF